METELEEQRHQTNANYLTVGEAVDTHWIGLREEGDYQKSFHELLDLFNDAYGCCGALLDEFLLNYLVTYHPLDVLDFIDHYDH